MFKILSFFILLFLFPYFSISQDQHLVDSLTAVLKTAKEDTSKANLLNQLSKSYLDNSPEKAMNCAKEALALAERIGYKKGESIAFNNIGIVYYYKGDYTESLDYQKKALALQLNIEFRKGTANSYTNIANVYADQGNSQEALKNYFAALEIYKNMGIQRSIANAYTNIGSVYYDLGNYVEALKNQFSALKIKEQIGDKKGIATSYTCIGTIYSRQGNYAEALENHTASLKINEELGNKQGMGFCYRNIGILHFIETNYPLALQNHFASLKLFEELGDKQGIASSYNNIGSCYENQGTYSDALKEYFSALNIFLEIANKSGIVDCYNLIGNIYTKQKKLNEASIYLNKALLLSKEIGGLEKEKDSYYALANLDSSEGNYRQALEHYKLFVIVRDSLLNKENTKKTVQQQMQYDFDEKEAVVKANQDKKDALAQKELQRQKLVRNVFVGGFAVVLLFAGVFFTQRNKISKEKKRSDELLLNILPAEVADELKEKGSAAAKQFEEVTVMFTDFKGFTQVSEKLTPTELVAEIHTCFKAFDNIIHKYGIEKIKTIGDSYMCVGGLPKPNSSHAEDVVNAGIEIRDFMHQYRLEREAKGELGFEIRIGINSGSVVAGIVGVKKFAYDIWGDTVNLASRMESSGEPGKVNISGSTYEMVKDKFACTHRGKVQAKNKGEVDMYFVENV